MSFPIRGRMHGRPVWIVRGTDVLQVQSKEDAERVLELGERIHGSEFAAMVLDDSDEAGDDAARARERAVQALLSGGKLLVRIQEAPRLLDPPKVIPTDEPVIDPRVPVEPPRPQETRWFELRLVDEIGESVEGVALSLSVSGEPRRLVTDADGRVRIDDATTGIAVARIADITELRDALRPRWEQARDGDWLDETEDHTYMDCAEPLPTASVLSQRVHTIVVQPRVSCARLLELLFETNKAFLLPSALEHIRSVRKLYDERPDADLLIVGHADITGEPAINDPLSLERARSVKAFLCDDVDAWLAYYEQDVASSARWGSHEDQLMLDAVLAASGEQLTDTPVRHFQKTRGLVDDGKLGPNTRRVLVAEYMAADGTSLPAGIEPVVHGCGENFPLDDPDTPNALDRRVELFFFDGTLGILPPPPGDLSPPDSPQYPEWLRRSVETHDFVTREAQHATLLLRIEVDEHIEDAATESFVLENHDATYRQVLRFDEVDGFEGNVRLYRFTRVPAHGAYRIYVEDPFHGVAVLIELTPFEELAEASRLASPEATD